MTETEQLKLRIKELESLVGKLHETNDIMQVGELVDTAGGINGVVATVGFDPDGSIHYEVEWEHDGKKLRKWLLAIEVWPRIKL